jgi:nucleoside-diphosphate-sugar epimerase
MDERENQMNALVTGGGGFIGAALIKQLVKNGYQTASFSRGDYPDLRRYGVEFFKGDLINQEAIKRACSNRDIVFHVAAKAGIWGAYPEYYKTNVQGTQNVVKACLAQDVKYLIFTSSASVVFNGKNIEGANETIPYPSRSMSHYTATKALAEQSVLKANCYELKTLSLRPHLVWGPGDSHIIPGIIARARSGKLRRIGKGDELIDTIYIDNCVLAHLCAAEAIKHNPEVAGKAYFITNGEPLPVWDFINGILESACLPSVENSVSFSTALIAAAFLELVYKAFAIKNEPYLTRFLVHQLCTSHWFDISAARKQLGYVPKISINKGFKQLASWFCEQETGKI